MAFIVQNFPDLKRNVLQAKPNVEESSELSSIYVLIDIEAEKNKKILWFSPY